MEAAASHDLGTERIPRIVWFAAAVISCAATIAVLDAVTALPAFVVFVVIVVLVSEVDTRELRIPNRLLAVGYAAAVPLLILATTADLPGASGGRALAGAAAYGAVFVALKVASPPSIGMADVKLAPLVGAHVGFLSWSAWTTALLVTFLANAIVGVVLLARRRAGRSTHLPFGPFMALGAIIGVLAVGPGG